MNIRFTTARKVAIFFDIACLILLLILAPGMMPFSNVEAQDNPIRSENAKPGTTTWQSPELFSGAAGDDEQSPLFPNLSQPQPGAATTQWTDSRPIKGYANKTSVNHGDSINLYVSTTQPSYRMEIYRMGWYGGAGARLILSGLSFTGHNYGVPAADPVTGMIAANWPVAYTLQTDSSWVSGVYQAKLIASDGSIGYIIFVVRADESSADILFQLAITTYQAYNNWGGKSLYDFNSNGSRAYKVSYDRPYELHAGAGHFYDGDYNMIFWLESQGYNMSYATSLDLEMNPNLLANHKVYFSSWHDEYWSANMRNHITAARDQGKHLAFFDSNNIYWQIRFESSSSGVPDRVQVCYKDATLDPMANSATPWLTTVMWRQAPVNKPENALLGVMYDHNYDYSISYPYVVANATSWVYEGTGLQNGSSIPSVIGHEEDRVFNNGLTPANLTILSNSPIPIFNSISNASIYTAPSGALVFDASTNRWSWLLADTQWESTPADPRIQRITRNILNRMIGTVSPPTNTPNPATSTTAPTFIPRTSTPAPTATGSAASGLKVQYRAINTSASAYSITSGLRIVNLTSSSVPLYELSVRYWFTQDTPQGDTFTCEYAALGCANLYGYYNNLIPPLSSADTYLEISFHASAGNLNANSTSQEFDVSSHKNDYSLFNQANDYSFDATKVTLDDWSKVTLYRNGVLVWGTEPGAASTAPHAPAPTFIPRR